MFPDVFLSKLALSCPHLLAIGLVCWKLSTLDPLLQKTSAEFTIKCEIGAVIPYPIVKADTPSEIFTEVKVVYEARLLYASNQKKVSTVALHHFTYANKFKTTISAKK